MPLVISLKAGMKTLEGVGCGVDRFIIEEVKHMGKGVAYKSYCTLKIPRGYFSSR